MIEDTQGQFSQAQAITASAASTNVIDFGATGTPLLASAALVKDKGAHPKIPLNIQVVEDFATLTSLTVSVQTDDNSGFSSAKTVLATQAIPAADLVAGYRFNLDSIPEGTLERYVRLYYTVAGSNATAGKITAGVVAARQRETI